MKSDNNIGIDGSAYENMDLSHVIKDFNVIDMHKDAVMVAMTKEKIRASREALVRVFSCCDLNLKASSSVLIWEFIHKEVADNIELSDGVYSDIHSLNPFVFSIKLNSHLFNINTLLTVYADEKRIEIPKELLHIDSLFFAVSRAVIKWIDEELIKQKGYSLKVCKCGIEWTSFLYGSTCAKCLVRNPLLGGKDGNI